MLKNQIAGPAIIPGPKVFYELGISPDPEIPKHDMG